MDGRRAIAAALALAAFAAAEYARPAPRAAIPAIYSPRPDDPWNRIFAALFTRTISTFKTDSFPDAGPFEAVPMLPPFVPPFRTSTRAFDVFEEGDRAVEALYPSFLTRGGTDYVLVGPGGPELTAALNTALDESLPRRALDRALMQSDLWSAFDALAPIADSPHETPQRRAAAGALLPRLARMIAKVALTSAEIRALPDTYAAARRTLGMPDLFASGGPWMEVVLSPRRMHDDAAQDRRASRVFVKPAAVAEDEASFLRDLSRFPPPAVSAAVLLMQTLLVDRQGRVVSTHLVSDVQMRTIVRAPGRGPAAYGDAIVDEYELSRRLARASGPGGGFVHFDAKAPAYLSLAGNDYGFATPMRDQRGETRPLLGTLAGRCSMCHGRDGAGFMTFNLVAPPSGLPPVVRLPQPNDRRGIAVAQMKEQRPEFARLLSLAGYR
jgi:hypothetical protein